MPSRELEPKYLPSEAEIAAACEAIRATWTPGEERGRRSMTPDAGGKMRRMVTQELTAPCYTHDLRKL